MTLEPSRPQTPAKGPRPFGIPLSACGGRLKNEIWKSSFRCEKRRLFCMGTDCFSLRLRNDTGMGYGETDRADLSASTPSPRFRSQYIPLALM